MVSRSIPLLSIAHVVTILNRLLNRLYYIYSRISIIRSCVIHSMIEKIRTFIAINIPDDVRAAIGEFQRILREHRADVKWVRPESIHITLKFLGDVETPRIKEIARSIDETVKDVEPFTVSVQGVGTFPNDRRPRVLWVGVKTGADILSDVAARIDGALSGLGFEKEKRRYSAHLTLGRVRSTRGIEAVIQAMRAVGFEIQPFDVAEIDVMKSVLQRTGAVYSVLERIKI